MILDIDPILKTAYQLKEDYIFFNSTASLDNAHDQLLDIIIKFKNSTIPSFVSFADSNHCGLLKLLIPLRFVMNEGFLMVSLNLSILKLILS